MNNNGFTLEDYKDNLAKCVGLLSSYLNQGSLGLILGAGASKAIKLPDWETIVNRCADEVVKGHALAAKPGNEELKRMSTKIKESAGIDYLELVKRELYKDVTFDFDLANKELLMAIMALVVGRTRGNVNQIITYNFDSVLEWFFSINGLRVIVSNKQSLFKKITDLEITHLHGFLPHNPEFGENSDSIIFTKEEFEDRMVQYSYWKAVLQDFFRRHVFVTVGLSADSILDDLCPYTRETSSWYTQEKVVRDQPYGIAILTPQKNPVEDRDQKERLLKNGIIPCTVEIPKIPHALFQIAQAALKESL